jgi:predicted nucleic acid-binding protein
MSVTETLAAYVAGSKLDAIARDVRDEAKRAIFNYLGCALGGSIEPALSNYFVDTSALAKRYLVETGTNWIRDWTKASAGNVVIISEMTTIEMFSLLNRRVRENSISLQEMTRLQRAFLGHVSFEYLVVLSESPINILARNLVNKHPLRTLDAIQLASAIYARETLGESMTFVCADNQLLQFASVEGFSVDNPNLH